MHVILITEPGGPEKLVVGERPIPEPRAGEVILRIAAAGVNAADLGQRRGVYQPPAGHSGLLGLEASGEVAEVGEGVQGFAKGDRVTALLNGGGYAEYVAVPAGQVLDVPKGWTMREAAALPETYFTIAQVLLMRAGLSGGMVVLVHGAAGGLGGAAIQISAYLGAKPIGLVSNAEKALYAQSLGAVAVIDHTKEDWLARFLELTGGRGADRILDMKGGDQFGRNIQAAAIGGHIIEVAALEGRADNVDVASILHKQLTISGSTLRLQSHEAKAAIAAKLKELVWPGLASGAIGKPKIREMRLAAAADAHRLLEQRPFFGKIVLVTPFGEKEGPFGAS